MANDDGERGFEASLHYGHPRMPLSDRAKIFVPFQALKGLDEALREQERRLGQEEESTPRVFGAGRGPGSGVPTRSSAPPPDRASPPPTTE